MGAILFFYIIDSITKTGVECYVSHLSFSLVHIFLVSLVKSGWAYTNTTLHILILMVALPEDTNFFVNDMVK